MTHPNGDPHHEAPEAVDAGSDAPAASAPSSDDPSEALASAVAPPDAPLPEPADSEPEPPVSEAAESTEESGAAVEGASESAEGPSESAGGPAESAGGPAESAEGSGELSRELQVLLSVRRSVGWASGQRGGAPGARYIGAASLRLLPDTPELSRLRATLKALDEVDEGGRKRVLGRLRRMLDTLLGEHAPRRPRRGRTKRRAAAPKKVESSREPTDRPEPSAEPRSERRSRRKKRRPSAASSPPAEATSTPPAKPVRRLLGHPEGTGRAIAALSVLDPDECEALAAAGVHTIADLLLRPPAQHARAPRCSLDAPRLEEPVTVRDGVRSRVVRLSPLGRRWEVTVGREGARPLIVRWLRSAPRGWDSWEAGFELGLHGVVRETDDGLVMYEGEPLGLDGRGSGLIPEYGIDGVSDVRLRAAVVAALQSLDGTLDDWLPSKLIDDHRLLPLHDALRDAHFPSNTTGRGRLRLAFDELFSIQIGVAWRSGRGKNERGVSHRPTHTGVGQLGAQHQIQLDDGQELAFSEIRRDLVRSKPMTRLLQGDVGSGKGLVAQMAAIMVAGGGSQVAMVSPDALTAERRFLYASPLLRSIGVKTLLVSGERPDRGQADAIRRGEAQVVFGTAGLLDKSVAWKRLGLVTVEERGPYGTVGLDKLQRRGACPDLLVIPRAPIPASLAFTVFGDYDVSVLPLTDRAAVSCAIHPADDRPTAYAPLRETIAQGGQGYVVFPVRDGRDLLSVDDAVRMAKALQADALSGARIGVYSSDMTREERARVFEDFQQRRIDVLVCTTYIEDAPAVANASAMVVEYADMHDLVRLHRLRWHAGSGHRAGSCAFVLSGEPAESALPLMEMLIAEHDGFRLAELDLEQRGAKALLAKRATEAPEFSWARPSEDRGLLMRARMAAFEHLSADAELRHTPAVADTVNARWGDWLGQALPKAPARRRSDGRRRRRRRR